MDTAASSISDTPDTLVGIDNNDISNNIIDIGNSESTKTLGIQLMSRQDLLCYKISLCELPVLFTKRQILSIISKIWDPICPISPVIILAKIIIQKLFQLQKPWDEPVPPELNKFWRQLYNQLPHLNSLRIPRSVVGPYSQIIGIHCFCDASLKAYASSIYISSVGKNNE
uniref:Uncharacterized protein LOC114326072 n=1 Tax=Diabrotica virgifera virgifera TaxID=50390 RepID=A0A6P7F5A7_DIAVI